jgi:hypothetical protein
LDGLVFSKFGSSGISGMMSVCINETLMPAAERTAIKTPGCADGADADGAPTPLRLTRRMYIG